MCLYTEKSPANQTAPARHGGAMFITTHDETLVKRESSRDAHAQIRAVVERSLSCQNMVHALTSNLICAWVSRKESESGLGFGLRRKREP